MHLYIHLLNKILSLLTKNLFVKEMDEKNAHYAHFPDIIKIFNIHEKQVELTKNNRHDSSIVYRIECSYCYNQDECNQAFYAYMV